MGVGVAVYLAKASSSKGGAIIGAIVLLPIGIIFSIQSLYLQETQYHLGVFTKVLFTIVGIMICSIVGALYGMILSKLFQKVNSRKFIV
jgi:hypothetical protein